MSRLLENTAERYRLKIRSDECGDKIAPGRFGQIRGWNEKYLRAIYMPDPHRILPENHPTHRRWDNRRERLQQAGCPIQVDCHGEGVVLFDPERDRQAKLVIEFLGVKQRRVLSETHRAALERAGVTSRFRRGVPTEAPVGGGTRL